MPKTQRLIITCLALATGIGIGWLFSILFTFEVSPVPPPAPLTTSVTQRQGEIYSELKLALEQKGVKVDGVSPYLMLEHFPTIDESDFAGVEAIVGRYEYSDATLSYESGEVVLDAAASDISEAGFALFLKNYSDRTGISIMASSSAEIISHMNGVTEDSRSDVATSSDTFVACTMDAKVCPDGSYVGRTGPDCEFAMCPGEDEDVATQKMIACTSEQKQAEACIEIYQPVCASVQIQCVTTPCEPIPKTFGNSCEACSENSVTQYTEGACSTE